MAGSQSNVKGPHGSARLSWFLASVAALGAVSERAAAQAVPGGNTPQAPSREEVEPMRQTPAAPPSTVSVESSKAIETGPCPLRDSNVRVNLQSVKFVGSADQPLAPELAALLGSIRPAVTGDQPIAAVCDLRDAANTALRRARYVASVQIPPQEIGNGELQLVVVAARIVEVVVSGDADRYKNALRPRIEQLKALYPINERDAERILLIAGDVPGIDVQLVLRSAGTKPGEVIGDMTVISSPVQVIANIQNPGSRQLGRELGTIRADFFGLTGMSDRTYLAFSNSAQWKEQHVIQGGHEVGIGASGFRAGVRASYALSRPSIPSVSLKSRSIIAGLDLSYPIVKQVNSGLTAWAGLEYIDQETNTLNGGTPQPFTKDRYTVAYARLDGYAGKLRPDGSSYWSVQGGLEFRQGLNLFNPTPKGFDASSGYSASRIDGDGRASVLRGTLEASVSPAKNVWLNASAFGQWTNSALLNLEEFSLGNLTYGRGYDPGANGSDKAVAFRVEPRVSITGKGTPQKPLKLQAEVFGFYDNVHIWNKDTGTFETRRTLDSIGGGVRLIWAGRMILDVTYAKPLKRALALDMQRPTDRLLVSLTTKLLPWRAR